MAVGVQQEAVDLTVSLSLAHFGENIEEMLHARASREPLSQGTPSRRSLALLPGCCGTFVGRGRPAQASQEVKHTHTRGFKEC